MQNSGQQDIADQPSEEIWINRLPEWAVPLIQYPMLLVCFVMAFGFVWLGGLSTSSPIGQASGWGIAACFVLSYLCGYAVWKARIGAAIAGMFSKGVIKLLWRLLAHWLFKKDAEPNQGLLNQIEKAMPGEEQERAFIKAFRKASRSFWIVAIPFALVVLGLTALSGGGPFGAAAMAMSCLAYGVALSWIARGGLLPMF